MTEITADIIASPETTDTADSPAPTKTRKEEFRAAMFAAHKAILAQLVEKRPTTFAPRGKACWPLKIGIHEDIGADLPDATRDDISRFLRVYTNNRRYWRSLKEGAPRLAIDGQPAGEVSTRDAEYAARMIVGSMGIIHPVSF